MSHGRHYMDSKKLVHINGDLGGQSRRRLPAWPLVDFILAPEAYLEVQGVTRANIAAGSSMTMIYSDAPMTWSR